MMNARPAYKGTRMTAEALAADFAARVNEHGWVWLTAKQVAYLRSLAQPVTRDTQTSANVVSYTVHGWPTIEGTLPDGREFTVKVQHNGAGCFQVR